MSLIVSVQGFASSTGATMKRHKLSCFHHSWSSGLLSSEPSQIYGFVILCRSPIQLNHIQAWKEKGFRMPYFGLLGLSSLLLCLHGCPS